MILNTYNSLEQQQPSQNYTERTEKFTDLSVSSLPGNKRNYCRSFIISGILNILTLSGSSLCQLILKTLMERNGDIQAVASTTYLEGFYYLTVYLFGFGTMRTLGIYSAQLFGKHDFLGLNLIFRQSLVLVLGMSVVFSVVGFFLLDYVFDLLGTEKNIVENSKFLIAGMAFPMLLRIVADIFRNFLMVQDLLVIIGVLRSLNFVIFWPYCYYFMIYKKMTIMGYLLCLTIFEALGLLCYLYIYLFHTIASVRSCTISISKNFFWFTNESFKVISVKFYNWIILIIYTPLANIPTYELAAYSVLRSIFSILDFTILAFRPFPKAEVNRRIATSTAESSRRLYYSFLIFFVIISIVLNTGMFFTLKILISNYTSESNLYYQAISRCLLPFTISSLFYCIGVYLKIIMISVERKLSNFIVKCFCSLVLWTVLSYYFVLLQKEGIFGIFKGEIFVESIKVVLMLILIHTKDWNGLRGITHSKDFNREDEPIIIVKI